MFCFPEYMSKPYRISSLRREVEDWTRASLDKIPALSIKILKIRLLLPISQAIVNSSTLLRKSSDIDLW